MYKDRISKWGLDKRHKEHEAIAIVRKKRQRDAVGKRSEFHIRGRLVSIEDVHRYLKRKGISVDDAIARRAATPPNLRCYTPEVIPSSPASPEIFEAHRRVLLCIRNYVLGSVESKTWSLDCDGTYVVNNANCLFADVTNECMNNFFNAYNLLELGSFQKAGYFLIKGSAVIQKVLLEQSPRFLSRLFHFMDTFRRAGWTDCSNIILNQFSKMATTVLADMPWGSFTDAFEEIPGSPSLYSTRNRKHYIFRVIRDRDSNLAEAQLRALVEKCKKVHGNSDPRYLEALLGLSRFLVQRRTRDAEAAVREAIRCVSERKFRGSIELWWDGMDLLAQCQYLNFDIKGALSTLRQLIDGYGKARGFQDAKYVHFLMKLERWLIKSGREGEAVEVSRQITEIMGRSNNFL